MDGKICKWLVLVVVALLQLGCASETKTSNDDDTSPALEAVPSHDDSHGWGANLQSAPK
jgi:hypothetical protein